jgi:hypothetical protein
MKKYLAAQDRAADQEATAVGQLNRFVRYYNAERPHRGIGQPHPSSRPWSAREKAVPIGPKIDASGYRIRHDKVDRSGSVTLRYRGKLHHIGVGCPYEGWRVIMLGGRPRRARSLALDGSPLRQLTLDTSVDYQRIP